MRAAELHLICGSTGAGKTTYAARLAEEIGGVCFAVDEWMAALFWPDVIGADGTPRFEPDWAMARVERCASLIWATALSVARRGTPCILELGLTTRAVRERYRMLAEAAGVETRLFFVDTPLDERWRRVAARNEARSGPLDFPIDRAMFDYVEAMWEAPDAAELTAHNGRQISA